MTAVSVLPAPLRPDEPTAVDAHGHTGLLARMRGQLDEAETLPELRRLVAQAEVLRVAARQAQLSADAQNDWAEYKLDASRRAGQVLAVRDTAKGSPGNQHTGPVDPSHDARGPVSYAELGLNYSQASRWQRLAALDDDTYAAYKIAARAKGAGEVTETGAVAIAKHRERTVKSRTQAAARQAERARPGAAVGAAS